MTARTPKLILCDNCGWTVAAHCKKHWVSRPCCPGCWKSGGKKWSQS